MMECRESASVATERAGIGPCIDVKAYDGALYAIQRQNEEHTGRLFVLNADLSVRYVYEGLGSARQIEIHDHIAVITARSDGLWIFRVGEEAPVLLCHYATVEYATGVALWGHIAFVSCRQYGVEAIDLTDPVRPRQIGLIRVGEVQSAFVYDGILFCGCWGEMKVSMVDLSALPETKWIGDIPIGGRGDGLCVRDGRLYAAIGQHARGIKRTEDRSDPCFGMGNGVEVYDLSDLTHPKLIGKRSFGKGYLSSVDMWEAALCGEDLVVNDSILGVFVMDRETLAVRCHVLPPTLADQSPDAVTGATELGGDLFFSTAFGDLFALRGLGLAEAGEMCGLPDRVFRDRTLVLHFPDGLSPCASGCYRGTFPILSVRLMQDLVLLACGEGGVQALDRDTLALRFAIPTTHPALELAAVGDRIYVAEGIGGVEIFSLAQKGAVRIGFLSDRVAIHQIKVSKSGRYLLCTLGQSEVKLYDWQGGEGARTISHYHTRKGLLYGGNFAQNDLPDGTMVLFCHRDGLITVNPDGGDFAFHTVEYTKMGSFCGFCAGEGVEVEGERILYANDGGLYQLSTRDADPTPIESVPFRAVAPRFKGSLAAEHQWEVACNRAEGHIWLKRPESEHRYLIETNASPGRACLASDRILIPGGRLGLIEIRCAEA